MLKTIKILAVALAAAAPLAESATTSVNVNELAQFVFPANRTKSVSLQFMPDGLSYLQLSADRKIITRHDTKTGKELEVMFDVAKTRKNSIDHVERFWLSPDGSKIMVGLNVENIYRRSYTAEFYVYEIMHRILQPLSTEHTRQRMPVFSPNGRMAAFVADDNNIYIKKLDYLTEAAVTQNGAVGKIINGVPDWTYEEEFSTECCMAWAPDSETLSYISFNETEVPAYSLTLYKGTCNPKPEYAYYPGEYTYKYPLAGFPNSKVCVKSYNIDNRKNKTITFSDPRIEYIPRIAYGPTAEQLIVTTLNRDQNRMEVYSVNPKSTVVKSLIVEESKAWINPASYEKLSVEPSGIVLMSDRSGFTHLYRYNYSGALQKQLTSGDYDVTDYYGTSADGTVYMQTTQSGPLNRVLALINKKGETVVFSDSEGTSAAQFAPAMNYYVKSYSNVTTPPVFTLYAASGHKKVKVLEDNAAVATRYAGTPRKEFFTMPDADGQYQLNGFIVKPSEVSGRHPVVMTQYSGPGSQQVLNRWGIDWETYFAMQGYVVVCVDGRGTGGRGRAFSDVVYRRLGYYESRDQIAAARYAASLPYADGSRIGICGWSYGGYETLMAASQPDAPYAAAVAIAPVTDWRYYDTVYTERYMTTPQQNGEGYDESSAIKAVNNMNTRLLIISGTADDNVHPANTMEYVSALQSSGRLCDMLMFPNMNHSIYGCNSRSLVYGKMLDFFNLHLGAKR